MSAPLLTRQFYSHSISNSRTGLGCDENAPTDALCLRNTQTPIGCIKLARLTGYQVGVQLYSPSVQLLAALYVVQQNSAVGRNPV